MSADVGLGHDAQGRPIKIVLENGKVKEEVVKGAAPPEDSKVYASVAKVEWIGDKVRDKIFDTSESAAYIKRKSKGKKKKEDPMTLEEIR